MAKEIITKPVDVTTTETTIFSVPAGKRLKVYIIRYKETAGTANTIEIKQKYGDTYTTKDKYPLTANEVYDLATSPDRPIFEVTGGTDLVGVASTGTVAVLIVGLLE